MSFHDVLFPVDIALNSAGGPTRRTEIITLVSGHEARNSPWAGSRRRYNAGYGVKSLRDIEAVIAFFEARRGRLYGFRFRDPLDHSSAPAGAAPSAGDQVIASGDGTATSFALKKRYASGGEDYTRTIAKPVEGSVHAAINGESLVSGTDYTVDHQSGILTLANPAAPGAVLTAGFLFDTPVRFDSDALEISLAAIRAGTIPSIPLIEVLT